jgi:hypothetical protein
MQNQNIAQYTEESPLAEEGRKLFRRLYGTVDGSGEEFKFEHYSARYFVHALLQEMLYNMVQYDQIWASYNRLCINDGRSGHVLGYKTLHSKQPYLAQPSNSLGIYYTELGNPFTTEVLEDETIWFHDIKYQSDKIINKDLMYLSFVTDYAQQYEIALDVLKDKQKMPNYVPAEIQRFVLKYQLEQKVITQEKYDERLLQIEIKLLQIEIKELIKQIENASNPQEIKKIIEYYKKISIQKSDSAIEEIKKFNDQINTILESKAFKDEYEKAKEFGGEAVKNFVRKLIQSLICSFYGYDKKEKKARHDKIDRNDTRTKNFKDFVKRKVQDSELPQIKQLP